MPQTDPRILTPERLAEIGEREKKATPGCCGTGWYVGATPEEIDGHAMWPIYRDGPDSVETIGYIYESHDSDLCAHARTDIPALLGHATAQQERIAELEQENSEMARMLAEPPESLLRIAALEKQLAEALGLSKKLWGAIDRLALYGERK